MDFLLDISRATGLPVEECLRGYRLTLVSGRACYIMRHDGMVKFSDTDVAFRIGRERLTVNGTDLTIKNLTSSDAVVVGKITSVGIGD